MREEKYDISGMNCAACSAAVERAVSKLGVESVSVNLLTGVMNVEFDESAVSDSDIRNAVKNAGFGIDTAIQSLFIFDEQGLKKEYD